MKIAKYFKLDENLITPIDTEKLIENTSSYIAKRPKHSGLKTRKIEDELGITTYSTDFSLNLLNKLFV